MAKKRTNTPPYMKRPSGSSHFVKLHTDLLRSPAFLDLSPKQKELYLACRCEEHGAAYRESVANGHADETLFYMNKALRTKVYEVYKPSDTRRFERDIAALIEHGFVDCVQSNYRSREKNLFRYSSRWHAWGTDGFSVPDGAMTNHMLAEREKRKSPAYKQDGILPPSRM